MKRYVLLSAFLLVLVTLQITRSEIPPKQKLRLALRKPDIVDLVFVSVNNWRYVVRNNGSYMYDQPDADGNGNNAGGEFPRGSGTTIVFAGGLYIGTIKDSIPVVSETEFATEFQPGRITNSGVPFNQLKAEAVTSPTNKVYMIQRGQTSPDYSNWPSDAPRDAYGNPALIADAQTWAVFNDLDTSLNQEDQSIPWGSPDPGLGIEVVLESFALKGAIIGDVVFLKLKLTNKTDHDYQQTYLAGWADPDVEEASNDIVGTDTSRNMIYAYNDNDRDSPLAVGLDFMQGPVVHKAEAPIKDYQKFGTNTQKLTYDAHSNRYIRTSLDPDQFIMGAVSANLYSGGTDPVNNKERYNLLRGREKSSGNPKYGCGYYDYHAFRGNPLTEQGTCDVAGQNNPDVNAYAADQRMLIATGPFTLKVGEPQEIWMAVIGAKGSDRLDAVAQLWRTSDIAQQIFEAGLSSPAPPAKPQLTAVALDNRVVLTWQNNSEYSHDDFGETIGANTANGYTADYVPYDFQGYRVYRSLSGLPGSFELLAQYDKADTLGVITYSEVSQNGNLITKEVDLGSNTGLRYVFIDNNVSKGLQYYYSVTAYDAQPYIAGPDSIALNGSIVKRPAGIPISLESPIFQNIVSAVPASPVLGLAFDASTDTIAHVSGSSDGDVEIEVIDPGKITGHTYRVEFFYLNSADGYSDQTLAYHLRDVDKGQIVPFDSRVNDPRTPVDERMFSTAMSTGPKSEEEFAIVDGMLIKIYGPPAKVKGYGYTGGNGTGLRWMTGVNLGLEAFFGGLTIGPNFAGSTVGIADYRDIDLVFSNAPAGWSIAYGHTGFTGPNDETFTIPFGAFEIDPVDGDATPHQVNVSVRDEANLNGWFLDNTLGGNGTGPAVRTYVYITNKPYDAGAGDPDIMNVSTGSMPTLFVMDMAPRNAAAVNWNDIVQTLAAGGLTAAERDSAYTRIPDNGKFHIYANHVLTPADTFAFSTKASTLATFKRQLKKELKDIRVVPNPFYLSAYEQTTGLSRVVKFINLPASCSIKIFTVAGDLVRIINHNTVSNNDRVDATVYSEADAAPQATSIERWDLTNHRGHRVASGMYIALIEAYSIGKTTVKFAVIR